MRAVCQSSTLTTLLDYVDDVPDTTEFTTSKSIHDQLSGAICCISHKMNGRRSRLRRDCIVTECS